MPQFPARQPVSLDPIGVTGRTTKASPCRELVYYGYYAVGAAMGLAIAYDVQVISDLPQADPLAKASRAIEVIFKIRDTDRFGASRGHRSMAIGEGWPYPARLFPGEHFHGRGMWSTAHEIGACTSSP